MTTDRPTLDDRRVLALAKARQQISHEGVLSPTWDELTAEEQEGALPDARNYLHAAIRAGLVPADTMPTQDDETAADRLRATRQTLNRYRSTLAAVRTAVTDAKACTGEGCTVDHRDVVLALIADIAGRLADATDEGEYHAVNLIGDLANGRTTVAEARERLADITFRHV